ncbi:MAG: 30S ribosomal protein S4 [Candidatus Paceibacterota bacterium]
MIVKSKFKICKRLGSSVFEKCQTQKFALAEARGGKQRTGRRPRAPSDYGKQLLEKQRVRYTYGISEKQFARYVTEATSAREPAQELLKRLESRLDNVAYRLGLAHTRGLARQLTSHGHLTVNGRRMTIPSHQVRKGDVIAVRDGSKEKGPFSEAFKERMKGYTPPKWLSFDETKLSAEVIGEPTKENTETNQDLGGVVEFYNK